jgi:hypothetical protein
MSAIPDGTTAGSWMQRARPEESTRRHQAGGAGLAASQPASGPHEGWDPYEVWLSRIERPRRRRPGIPGA